MNSGFFLYVGGGRVKTTSVLPNVHAPNAVPFKDGSICINTSMGMAPVSWVSGLPYGANGRISCQPNPAVPIARYIAGLGITAAGRLAVDQTGKIDHYVRGIPMTAAGRVCIEPPVERDEDDPEEEFQEEEP